jgi:membrane-bound lytic murein transglycosylase A
MAARRAILVIVVLLLAAAAAFWYWRSLRVPQAGQLVLIPQSFSDLPGWSANDPRPAFAAFKRSCESLEKQPPAKAMGGAGYAGSVSDWLGVCSAAPQAESSAQSARAFFENWFQPVSIAGGNAADGLFTGYYEPELAASHTRHGAYQTPIYGMPNDLITADLGAFKPQLAGEKISGRVEGSKFVPYATRGEIDAQGLPQAPTLLYAADPVQVFFLHIQGSGRVKLDDGRYERIAYAGQNGRPYTPIGRVLIASGDIDRADMSMQAIRAWLKSHPREGRAMMEQDQSFVFFKEEPIGDPSVGAEGSEGVALAPGASLAVDQHLHPLGAPIYVATVTQDLNASKGTPVLQRLMIAQDTGGAIKGAVRGDVFWGSGAKAEDTAGRMTSHGQMFVLLPKPVAARLGARAEYGTAK